MEKMRVAALLWFQKNKIQRFVFSICPYTSAPIEIADLGECDSMAGGVGLEVPPWSSCVSSGKPCTPYGPDSRCGGQLSLRMWAPVRMKLECM